MPDQPLLQQVSELFDHSGVELDAAQAIDFHCGLLNGPGRLIGPLMRQCVEHIGHTHNPADERDLFFSKATGVAAAVPALVMGQGDLLGTWRSAE